MSKFVDDILEDIDSDANTLQENISPEEIEDGMDWKQVCDMYIDYESTDEILVSMLYTRKRFIKWSLPLLIKDLKLELSKLSDTSNAYHAWKREGFEKAIDYIKNLQEELEKAVDY